MTTVTCIGTDKKYLSLNVDVDEVPQWVLNCCTSTMCAITEAHDLEHCIATEVMLFLLTDMDRSFNKDRPHTIPVAYALKGKSLTSATARRMVSDVRDFLDRNKINVLVEAYDGQWSNLVFQDSEDKPLTLFKLQRDSWLKFKRMSQKKLINFIESISRNPEDNLPQWSATSLNPVATHRIGNIETSIKWHTKQR